jgi:hypothetical protein
MWLSCIGMFVIYSLTFYLGLVMYTHFKACDPLLSHVRILILVHFFFIYCKLYRKLTQLTKCYLSTSWMLLDRCPDYLVFLLRAFSAQL